MNKITYDEFRTYVDSSCSELDFFSERIDEKQSFIKLKDYLLEVKKLEKEFEKKIEDPLEELRKKNKWVDSIYCVGQNEIKIFGKKQPSVGILNMGDSKLKLDNTYGSDNPIDFYIVLPLRMNSRQKVILNSEKELLKIIEISNHNFDGYQQEVSSASEIFGIGNSKMFSYFKCNGDMLFNIDKEEMIPDDYTFSIFDEYCDHSKQYNPSAVLTIQEKQKLIEKTYIKKLNI